MGYGNLLNASDGDPVRANSVPVTESPSLFVGDHAGSAIPARLNRLGLSPKDRSRHIALDLGVRALGPALPDRLNAPFLWQHFSRLVCDCNRSPEDPQWAAEISDETKVPGNMQMDPPALLARREEIFEPYHAAIAAAISARQKAGQPTLFVSLHSFTPSMAGQQRPCEIGILHDGREDGFALSVLSLLKARECTVSAIMSRDLVPHSPVGTNASAKVFLNFIGKVPYESLERENGSLGNYSGCSRIGRGAAWLRWHRRSHCRYRNNSPHHRRCSLCDRILSRSSTESLTRKLSA